MTDTAPLCVHGFEFGSNAPGPGMMFAAPFDTCSCCRSRFPFVDTFMMTGSGTCSTDHTPGLCHPCGGVYNTTYTGSGQHQTKAPGEPWKQFRWWTDEHGAVHTETTEMEGSPWG